MRKLTPIGVLLGTLLVGVPTAQSLSAQVLSLLTRINTWTARNTFYDLRLNPGVPSDTTNRFYADMAGSVYYGGILLGDAGGGGVTPHNILSTTHSDSLTGTVVRGDVIIGNSTPKWSRLGIGAAGTFLRSDGTDVSWGTVASALTSIPAANLTGTSAAIVGTAITALNASNLASGTVPLARLAGITTTEISASAAIPYSKLSLTGGVVNADVDAAAAIAYAKLNLNNALVNADLTAGSILFTKWGSNSCTNGQVPQYDGANWGCATIGVGTGTVTSVALSLPAIFSVSGSPVTTTGTLTGALATQTANTVWAGPGSAGPSTPTFRALVNADLPVTGVVAGAYSGAITVNTAGVVTAAAAALNLASGVGASILPMANGGTGVAVSADDTLLIGSGAAWVAQSVPNCTTGLAYATATNLFSCASGGVGHNLLSATHSDTLAASPPTRGDLIVANSTPVWARKAIGTAGQLLTNDGTDTNWGYTFARGTITTSSPWTFSQTWNAGGVTFTGLALAITNTASAAASTLLDLTVGGSSMFAVNVAGVPTVVAGLSTTGKGLPLLRATTGLLSGQTANIGVTDLVSGTAAGLYRVCAFEGITTAASSSSTMPRVTVTFNSNGATQTYTLIASDSTNTLGTFGQGCMVVQATAASSISYDAGTTGGAYASSGGTAMQYQLRIMLETLF